MSKNNKETKSDTNRFTVWENYNSNEKFDKIIVEASIGDIIDYMTNNQLGVRIYEVYFNTSKNKKDIKEIGDIYGFYSDPNHPDFIE